jgi:hypothetical protein
VSRRCPVKRFSEGREHMEGNKKHVHPVIMKTDENVER